MLVRQKCIVFFLMIGTVTRDIPGLSIVGGGRTWS